MNKSLPPEGKLEELAKPYKPQMYIGTAIEDIREGDAVMIEPSTGKISRLNPEEV